MPSSRRRKATKKKLRQPSEIHIGNFAGPRIVSAMIRLAGLGVMVLTGGILVAVGAETGRLPADQLTKAVRSDSITIPTPGELFTALEKSGKINWAGQYRGPIPVTYSNRAQIALNLGGLIADGFIAVEQRTVSRSKILVQTSSNSQKRSASAKSCLVAGVASTNLPRTTNGTRCRRNWKRRRTK